MKKIFLLLTIFTSELCFEAFAQESKTEKYPNVTGQILFESRNDHVISTNKQGVEANNAFINIEPDFSLNINEHWSAKTGLRILPVSDRKYDYPERSRTFLGDGRGLNQDDTGVVIEELKVNFENEDMKFFAGKFNPTFGTMYRRTKRIGLFVTDITEEYELREKIGLGVAALLEDSEITLNGFFNDTTGLSGSGINNRKREDRNDGLAGNTQTLSSYSITMEGEKLFGVHDLFYNIGYRSLGVDKIQDNARESAYTINVEYLKKLGKDTSLIPLIEIVKIKNFTGRENRNAEYMTLSLMAKYSGWNASVASVYRNIDNNYAQANRDKSRDNLLQLSVGYKFTNNIAIDVSRASLKEDGHKGSLIGVIVSYLYKF